VLARLIEIFYEKKVVFLILIIISASLMSCAGLGPKTVTRDRFNYNTEISKSWKEQTLLNIVKLRYADMPMFVEVASVVSGYTLEGSVNLNASFDVNDSQSLGGSGTYIERPTITYVPITGQKFNKTFMTPIPPALILFLIQSGWPVDLVFTLTVDSVNQFRSRISGGENQREGNIDFYRIIALFRKIQKSGTVGMRVNRGDDKKETSVIFFFRKNISPEIEAALVELTALLGLPPGVSEIPVGYGLIPRNNQEIAMLTRSMLQIMVEMSSQVDVPAKHVTDGRTVPVLSRPDSGDEAIGQIIDIKSSKDKPVKAYTAVKYQDHWFWINETDFKSKRAFTFLMILFSMTESGSNDALPMVTIPTG
jgi:hypothetical protein